MATRTKKASVIERLATEDLIDLHEAAAMFPVPATRKKPHYCTMLRYCNAGKRGVVLESFRAAGRVVTTKQAVTRFLDATSGI